MARRIPGGIRAVLALVFTILVVVDHRWTALTEAIDARGGDIMLRQLAKMRPVSNDVVIVDIDQRSLEEMNEYAGSWPWPRSVHGELIDSIAKQAPKGHRLRHAVQRARCVPPRTGHGIGRSGGAAEQRLSGDDAE